MTTIDVHELEAPFGTIRYAHAGDMLFALAFGSLESARASGSRWLDRIGDGATLRYDGPRGAVGDRLAAYFAGELDALADVRVSPIGTPFQRLVWAELRRIPLGETISYAELARRIGRPSASRAVGLANGRNPIAVVVPCHRVIGADGSLTGFAGGLPAKRWLLTHEGASFAA